MIRRLRISLAYALTPLVAGAITIASLLPAGKWQKAWLTLLSAAVIFALSVVALPRDADDDYAALRRWLATHRLLAAPVALLVVAAIFAFEHVRERMPGRTWTGSWVQLSVALWPLSLLLYHSRRFVTRGWRGISSTLAVVNVLGVLVVPFFLFQSIEGRVSLRTAVLLLIVTPLVLLALLSVARAHTLEQFATPALGRAVTKRPRAEDERARARARGRLAIASCFCALASALLLLASAIRVPIERRLLETSQVAERGARLPPLELQNPSTLTPADRRALLERYSPVLRLHEDEVWAASNAAAALAALKRRPTEHCPEERERPCAEAPIGEVLKRLPGDSHPPSGTRVFSGGAVYPRLVTLTRGAVEREGVPQVARHARWLAQYWLFYPFNDWRARSAVGKLAQSHAGDWEWVGVGIDVTGAPLFVAYSAHCAGTWRPWTDAASVAVTAARRVLVGGTPEFPASHPLVIVAKGSHANYATTGTREPDWGGCEAQPSAARAVRWLTFAAAAREETPELGTFQVAVVLPEATTKRDATRPIWWGSSGETVLGRVRLGTDDHGPPSPSYQSGWRDPIHTIFSTDWECDAGRQACEAAGEDSSGTRNEAAVSTYRDNM